MAKTDEEKAAFMRAVGATHAEWSPVFDGTNTCEMLTKLTLGPAPVSAERTMGPAQRMAEFHQRTAASRVARQHDILFAASSVKPKLEPSTPPAAVPRAVRAKEEAARRGGQQG